MIVYLDLDFKCHTQNDGTMRAAETAFFDGKCETFIEGYRFVPTGESWTRDDGAVFAGEMISPIRDYWILAAVQKEYERNQEENTDMETALSMLEVRANG